MSEVSAWSYPQREQREIRAELRESTWVVLDPSYPTVTTNGLSRVEFIFQRLRPLWTPLE